MKKTVAVLCALGLAAPAPFVLAGDDHARKAEDYFNQLDTNRDGRVSPEEHRAASERMFAEADTNGDGSLSKEELKAYKMKGHKK